MSVEIHLIAYMIIFKQTSETIRTDGRVPDDIMTKWHVVEVGGLS